MDVDDKDGFGPIRSAQSTDQVAHVGSDVSLDPHIQAITSICVSFLAFAPALQSTSGEATRDRELTDLVLRSDGNNFLLLAIPFTQSVRQKTLMLSKNSFNSFLDKFSETLELYDHSHDERVQWLLVDFLRASLPVWLQSATPETIDSRPLELALWLLDKLEGQNIRSWKVRNAVCGFLVDYLHVEPKQTLWPPTSSRPSHILHSLEDDVDIRVRCKASICNAKLFGLTREVNDMLPMTLYDDIYENFSINIDE
jgi:ataxia telangiectasia mutated family protein